MSQISNDVIETLNSQVAAGENVEKVAELAGLIEVERTTYERETADTAILYQDAEGRQVTGWITRNCDGTPRGEDGFDTEFHPFEK